jgi:hypothetical protein
MPHYRAYLLDEQGHLIGAVNFDCAEDEAAKERARQALDHHYSLELWRQVPLLGDDGRYEP